MPSRKRSLEAADGPSDGNHNDTLHRIRNMWHFANLIQWIYTFGKAARIDESLDVEVIETECLKPNSTVLADIAVNMMRLVSNHRGLTHDILDSQMQKHFLAKAPDHNPFGDDETPLKFNEFDTFTKIITLQRLTQWAMIHPERVREKMDEQKDSEQTSWRIEPYGWDSEDRTYFVLDDNRVYRLTEPPPAPAPRPKKKKTFRAGRRTSKRRRTDNGPQDGEDLIEQEDEAERYQEPREPQDDGLGGMKWECLAISLDQVRHVINGFQKSRDENEKILRKQLEKHLIPILEKQEESRKRKAEKRERELANLAKMANAKRSSRLAGKIEQQKQEEETKKEMQQIHQAEVASRREEQARLKREKERDFRMASRGERLKEREARRIRHEEDLAQLSEDSRRTDDGSGRVSERHLRAEIERKRQALKELEDEDDDWIFDCSCGLYGQVDDGEHSVACEKCNVWQHSNCLGISEMEADRADFHFICQACRRYEDEANGRPKVTIKLNHTGSSSSPPQPTSEEPTGRSFLVVEIPSKISFEPPTQAPPSKAPQKPQTPAVQVRPLAQDYDFGNRGTGNPLAATVTPRTSQPQGPLVHHEGRPKTTPGPSAPVSGTPSSVSRHLDPVPEATLTTPTISREIYRAGHLENGNIPSSGGMSPVKHSPHSSFASVSPSRPSTTMILPPSVTLSPAPRQPILTPPVKHPEPVRPAEWH